MRVCLGVITLLMLAQPLAATVLLPADFATMVGESQWIVQGRIVDVHGVLAGDRRSIESLVTVEVLAPIKGQPGREVTFRVPGGKVGRYRRVFVGAPAFAAGEEVVLFLKARAPAIAMPFGLSQGVYRVSRVTGRAVVVPVPPAARVAGTLRGDPARQPLPLEEFTRQVRVLVQAGR